MGSTATATATAFALATPATRPGRYEFLRRGAFVGNLMRTDSPFHAWTFPSVAEASLWLENLSEGCKEQLRDRPLHLVPLTIAVGEPAETITLRTIEPAPGTPIGDGPPRWTLDTSKTLFGGPTR